MTAPPAYACPACDVAIPLVDVNVQADIALCRGCGATHPFTKLASVTQLAAGLDDIDLRATPRHLKRRAGAGGRVIVTHARAHPLGFILTPFALIWSGVSIGGIYGSQFIDGEFDVVLSLFGIPFALLSLFLVGAVLFALFGKLEVTISHREITVFRGLGSIGRRRRLRFDDGTKVRLETSNVKVNETALRALVLTDSTGKRVQVGAGMTEESRRWLAAFLDAELSRNFGRR